MSERVLIIGGGGREHSLAWSLAQSPDLEHIECAPGNVGTANVGANVYNNTNTPRDIEALLDYNEAHGKAFIVVGSENQLVLDIVGRARRRGQIAFGPDAEGAQLETSKIHGAEFMKRCGISTPDFQIALDMNEVEAIIRSRHPESYAEKADGPAGGKGVDLPKTRRRALKTAHSMMVGKRFGEAGEKLLFQDRVEGPELSVIAICDGEHYVCLPFARDHKRFKENGPNTGGIAAYTPVAEISSELTQIIREQFIERTLTGLAEEGNHYKGALYIGLVLTEDGPQAIEYNVRFGDPETQAQLMLLNEDLYPLLWGAAHGELGPSRMAKVKKGAAAVVTLATRGYPNKPRTGQVIFGLDDVPEDVQVFHGGTQRNCLNTVTSGGRALHIASYGETLEDATNKIYRSIGKSGIHFAAMQYRKGIGLAS